MPVFFNPAANLTANRIPYALGGGRLADDSNLSFDSAGSELRTLHMRMPNTGKLRWLDSAGSQRTVLTMEANDDVILSGRYGVTNIRLSTTGNPDFVMKQDGKVVLGSTTASANARLDLATHTTINGGYGFFDFGLYRDGAKSLRTDADYFRIGSSSTLGRLLTAYGTFADPAYAVGDSGNGFYNLDPGGGRVLYIKGYSGRTAFRNSGNTANILALTDAAATLGVPLNGETIDNSIARRNAGQTFYGNQLFENPNLVISFAEQAVRTWQFTASGGDLSLSSADNGGNINLHQDIHLKGPGGTSRWIYDGSGNRILRERSATVPATLGDVIAILQYHGLCS